MMSMAIARAMKVRLNKWGLLFFGACLYGFLCPASAFTLVTYNVAEFHDSDPLRIQRLLNQITDLNPDIAFLQEAGKETLQQVRHDQRLKEHFKVEYVPDAGSLPSSGLIFLNSRTNNPIKNTRFVPLPSEMDRGLLMAEVTLCGSNFTIVNVHLESPDLLFWRTRATRGKQIEQFNILLKDHNDFIIAGDFNLMDTEDMHPFPENWKDVWALLHSSDPGLTWDPKTNDLAWKAGGFILPGYRLDRVLYKSETLHPRSIGLMGKENREKLSDHYGIATHFDCEP